jgi:hypothetical protein
MYQNFSQLQQSPYYQYPYAQQYQRLAQMEQQAQQQYAPQNYLKGRPVVSLDEARAAQIDLDGSLFVFTDIGNKKIYTKQINLDGTATLNTYSLVEDVAPSENYVTKTELDNAVAALREEMNKGIMERNGESDTTRTQKPIINKSSF